MLKYTVNVSYLEFMKSERWIVHTKEFVGYEAEEISRIINDIRKHDYLQILSISRNIDAIHMGKSKIIFRNEELIKKLNKLKEPILKHNTEFLNSKK